MRVHTKEDKFIKDFLKNVSYIPEVDISKILDIKQNAQQELIALAKVHFKMGSTRRGTLLNILVEEEDFLIKAINFFQAVEKKWYKGCNKIPKDDTDEYYNDEDEYYHDYPTRARHGGGSSIKSLKRSKRKSLNKSKRKSLKKSKRKSLKKSKKSLNK